MADPYGDQAAGLRRLFATPQLRIISFAAGCAGVGKSLSVINLATILAGQGREVVVFDENAEAGVLAFYGAPLAGDLLQVVHGERSLVEVMPRVAPGIRVLPAARLVRRLSRLSEIEQRVLVDCLGEIEPPVEVILVDTSLDHPLAFSPLGLAADDTVVVVTPDPAAITDAYALIKKVSLGYARKDFRILVNQARSPSAARAIHDRMAGLTGSRRLARLDYAGHVPFDERLDQAARLCQPVSALFPDAPAASAYRRLVGELLSWPAGRDGPARIGNFVQLLLNLSQRSDPAAIYA